MELWREARSDEFTEDAHLCCGAYCTPGWPEGWPAMRLMRVPFDEAVERMVNEIAPDVLLSAMSEAEEMAVMDGLRRRYARALLAVLGEGT